MLASASVAPDRKEDRERHVAVARQQQRRQAQELTQKINVRVVERKKVEKSRKGVLLH